MQYKYEHIRNEYLKLPGQVKEVMTDLEAYCRSKGYAEPMATEISRTRKRNIEYYTPGIMKKNPDFTKEQAEAEAAKRWTWHLVDCCIDLRDWVWTPAQIQDILNFLKARCQGSLWEILYHDIGKGMHFHVGYRDFARRKEFELRESLGK